MIGRAIFTLLFSCWLATAAWGADELRGKFVLSAYPKEGANVPEAIEFLADGSCVLEVGGHAGVKGIFRTDKDSKLTLEYGPQPKSVLTFHYCLQTYTLTFCENDGGEFVFVKAPTGPHLEFKDFEGIYLAHMDAGWGDSATEITPDHKFRVHARYPVPGELIFYDIYMDGTCTYADGIITYLMEHDNTPEKTKYIRDFVMKRDEKGIWIVDYFHDKLVCETPGKNLDLPDPPPLYKLVKPQ